MVWTPTPACSTVKGLESVIRSSFLMDSLRSVDIGTQSRESSVFAKPLTVPLVVSVLLIVRPASGQTSCPPGVVPTGDTTAHNVQACPPALNMFGQICTSLTNPTMTTRTYDVCFVQQPEKALFTDPMCAPMYVGVAQVAAQSVPANSSPCVCVCPPSPGVTAGYAVQLKDASNNICAMTSFARITIPPTPGNSIVCGVQVGSNVPNPATDTQLTASFDLSGAPAGTTATAITPLAIPSPGSFAYFNATFTVSGAPVAALVRASFSFVGASRPVAVIEWDLTALGSVSAPPSVQVNSPGATMLLNGAVGTPFVPITVPLGVGQTATLAFSSVSGLGLPWDIGVAFTGPTSIPTPSGQFVNVDITDPSFFFLMPPGGFTPGTMPVSVPFATLLVGQMVIFDPVTPDGFVVSQPTALNVL